LLQRERTALAEAEASLRSSDAFLAMLSHELRNPLSAITTATALLELNQSLDDSADRAREIVSRQTGHLTRLIDDLLDMARITAGKLTLHRERANLAEIAEAAVRTITAQDPSRAACVELDLEPVMVDADPDRLDQVVVNLVHNALKYTPSDGTIRVRTRAEGGSAVLRVEDTGSGIVPELLPRVFDLFTQSAQGPDRAHGGLGVGLTLVRRLVHLHAGEVEAQSEGAGRGSTFIVRLPRAPERAAHDPRVHAPRAARYYRILLVEDSADARETLRLLLESAGHTVVEAADGPAAVQHALGLEPDFALVDLGLPGFDGHEVARRIRAANVATQLVAVTGYGRDEDHARSREAGFHAHLVKPVTLARLHEVLDALFAPPAPGDE
jgi:CheY-like chemotaxis protein